MAKLVQVSDDSGSNWYTLPGGEGDIVHNGAELNDTVFGKTFQSNETGLIGFSGNGTALYRGFAGYHADLKEIDGASAVFTTEACTLVSGKTFQIDDIAKRLWDKDMSPELVVFDNAVDHTADVIEVDHLFGKITFAAAYSVTTPITITGKSFSTVALAKANSFTLGMTAEAVEDSDYVTVQANGGYRTFDPGLRGVALEVGGIYAIADAFRASLVARTTFLLEIDPVGDGLSICRGFFKLASAAQSGAVGALEDETVSFTLQVPFDDTIVKDPLIPFGWQHLPTTTLSTAIQKMTEAWEAESQLDYRYLYDGTNGVSGTGVLTSLSLSGGIDAMNEFSMSFVGNGASVDVGTG